MPTRVPPLPFFCIHVLAGFTDQLYQLHRRRIPASPALLDALHHTRDPCVWATLVQLVHPLPPDFHELDIPLSHPALPLLQKIPESPDFTLVTLLSLPNCLHLHDDNIAHIRTLHSLLALDLRGCSISSSAFSTLARDPAVSSSNNSRTGTLGLRLLSLHGCPNIDNDALSALQSFPLLSAVDLRFTRCTQAAVNARLSSLGFRPSDNNSLFHPAPLSLALCTLEKVALTASDPISLYPCPVESVFRVYVDELNHLPARPQKAVPVGCSSTSHANIRTTSSAEDIVVYIPPLRKPVKNESIPPSKPSISATAVLAVPTPSTDQPTCPNLVSNVSSFYENAPTRQGHSKKNIFPLSAQAVRSSQGSKLDPLAIARSPPPWKITNTYNSLAQLNSQGASPDNTENTRRRQPIARWAGQALNNPLKVDRTRLYKRGSDAVAEMVHQFTSKRSKTESEFALERPRPYLPVESRNPFVRSARPVFVESRTNPSNKPRHSAHGSSMQAEPDTQLRMCRSLPSKTARLQGTATEGVAKPLKPITSLKPPALPKELLPLSIRHTSKTKPELKQTRLTFSGERYQDAYSNTDKTEG